MNLKKLASNFHSVENRNFEFYFSYETLIGYNYRGDMLVSENVWSRTTAKHINELKRMGAIEVEHEEFNDKVERLLASL